MSVLGDRVISERVIVERLNYTRLASKQRDRETEKGISGRDASGE